MVVTMTHAPSSVLLSGLLVLGLTAGAYAQGTQQGINAGGRTVVAPSSSQSSGTGTAVPTGQGPLTQPVGPAASSLNRPVGGQTNPSPQPFGQQR